MTPFDKVRWQFPDVVWERGLLIFYNRAVTALAYDDDDDVWNARVLGSSPQPYAVWLGFEDDDDTPDNELITLDGDCDCPSPKPCKHLAAVACAVMKDMNAPGPAATPQQPRLTASPAAFEQWAMSTERALQHRAPPSTSPSTTSLRFVVTIDTAIHREARPRVVISAWSAALRRGGGRPIVQPYDLDACVRRRLSSRPAWIDDGDCTTWFRLHAATRHEIAASMYAGSATMVAFDATGAELFAEIVATGRCHLYTPEGLRLGGAPPRPGRVGWQLDDEGRQTLHIEPADRDDDAGWRLLPLAPLHYIEPETGLCGPITLDVATAAQPWLTTVPAVEPEWSAALPSAIQRALQTAGVPAPLELEATAPHRGTPVPVLRLHARGHGRDKQPTATLGFDYDGIAITPTDRRSRLVRIDGTKVERIDRDLEAETRARQELARHGLFGEASALTMPDDGGWYDLARTTVPALETAGWRVEIDDDFEWTALGVDDWYANARDDDTDREAWFLELGVVVAGERINILPAIVAAIRTGTITRERLRVAERPLIVSLADGRRIELDRARLQMMLDVLVELHGDGALHDGELRLVKLDAPRIDALVGFTWEIGPRLRAFADRLRSGPVTSAHPPPGLAATLRDYQLHGLSWLQWLRDGELGGILADDMGLGKTIQALAHVLLEKQAGRLAHPVLVVAPRSVLHNWQREAERFTPDLRVAIHHGPFRHAITAALETWDIVITTYALLQRDELLAQTHWHLVVLDEAQAIKNPTAKVSIAARALHADQRICMTGTPMENNLGDLWSLMSFVNPGLLGSSRQFTSWYRTPIEKHGDVGRFDAMCRRIAPFLLRRTKAQVLTELPPKTEVVLNAELDGPQRDLYESVRLMMEKRVRDELGRRGLARSRIIVLDALLKLRQVCCDPQLVKLARAAAVRSSAKLDLLLELVEELVGEGRRALVFSQFTTMLAIIERELDARHIPWLSITGKTVHRQAIVDRFQTGEVPILLVSLKAGGTGLNLTAADTVIHYDPWWNPAVEAQATDRAHRIGQDQPITVYRLICEGTVEERMLALQAKKSALIRGVHDSAERRAGAGLALDEHDIAALLAPIGEDGRGHSPRS